MEAIERPYRPKPWARRAILCAVLALMGAAPAPATDPAATRRTMDEVYEALAYLLPLSVREPGRSSPYDRELIDAKLASLTGSAAVLVAHSGAREEEFRYLARSFQATVEDIVTSFAEQWPPYAYFSLMELTQHCVACHSRLPAEGRHGFGERLLARMDVAQLEPREVSDLYVATRQFDSALGVLEKKILAPDEDAVELDRSGVLVDYLNVALAVASDAGRADRLLADFAARPDLPYYLARRIAAWRASLASLAPQLTAEPTYDAARRIFADAGSLTRAPQGREQAIHDLTVANLLHRYLAGKPLQSGPEVADAYYMLGIVALRTVEPKYSVPMMESLFASAVRADPHGPRAAESYALLEEFGYIGDTPLADGAGSQRIIDMARLRALLDAPPTAAPE